MIESMAGAHTDGSDEPTTVYRALRRVATGLGFAFIAIGLSLLIASLAVDDVRIWSLGCTCLIMAGGSGAVAACVYIGERLQRGQAQLHSRLDAVEAGERIIAEAVQQPLDEVRRRREG